MKWLAILILAIPLSAGVNRWTEIGPPGSQVVAAIALDPFDENVIYALISNPGSDPAARHGLWQSRDAGATWKRLNLELAPYDYPVTIRVASTGILYALSEDAIHRSIDGGNTWVRTETPDDYLDNTDLVIDPNNSNRIYVGVENNCVFGPSSCIDGGIWRSDDGGKRWHELGPDKRYVAQVVLDPSDRSTLYAVSRDRVYQTRNGGSSWKDVSPSNLHQVTMMVVDPVIPSTIFAVSRSDSIEKGTFKSTDRAQSWRVLEEGMLSGGPSPNAIAIDPVHSSQLLATTGFGAVVRSTNGGESWSFLNDGLEKFGRPTQLIIAPSGTVFYAAVEGGHLFHFSVVPPRRRAAGR